MRGRSVGGALAAAIAMLAALGPSGLTVASAEGARTNAVIEWNQTMLSTFATAAVPAPPGTRLGAIVQSAVFDAVNGIQRRYTPIHVQPAAADDASPQAAAVGAAYTALVGLFPGQKPALDAALGRSLATMRGGDGDDEEINRGLDWGAQVAHQTLAWRAADAGPLSPYVLRTGPGQWQPTAGGAGDPRFRVLSVTTPFAMSSRSQFRPAPPPALTGARYATDLDEVARFGSLSGSARTTYQTETARFWQLDTVTAIWDRVADSLALRRHLGLLESARLLALADISMADAVIAVWDAKNVYNFWRPETAIGDPTWHPLMVTPYFQEYPSGHSGASGAVTSILASAFGAGTDFTATSAGLPGVERSFESFNDAVAQIADARVFAGFHFRFSCDVAAAMGRQVAAQVRATLMRPLGEAGGEGD